MSNRVKNGKVFVQGPGKYGYLKMFYDYGFTPVTDLSEADLCCFTGGEDVDPELYQEKPLSGIHFNTERDKNDIACFELCRGMFIPMVGICRGAQFLNVMNGGSLWQHIEGHLGNHNIVDLESGLTINVTSTHHQQMRLAPSGTMLANCYKSTEKHAEGAFWSHATMPEDALGEDAEVVWYDDTQCLCFQPHPEFGTPGNACTTYFMSLIESNLGLQAERRNG